MAEFAELSDEGFQGRLFPHQRAKLREHFCLNPWPDVGQVNQIAAEIGVPEFVISKYFNYVRDSQNQLTEDFQIKTQHYEDGSPAESRMPAYPPSTLYPFFHKLEQYLVLDPDPSFQAITNIGRELGIPRRLVEQFFDEKRTKVDEDIDNMLDEMLESPLLKEDTTSVDDSHLDSEEGRNLTSNQDELMLALSEVGLSTGQMSKFCSELYDVPEDNRNNYPSSAISPPSFFSNQSGFNNPSNFGESLHPTQDSSGSSVNYGAQVSSSVLVYNQNPQVQSLVQPVGQYRSFPYDQSNYLNNIQGGGNQTMPATLAHSRSTNGSGNYYQQASLVKSPPEVSEQSPQYEIRKDDKKLPQQHLFHQYMQKKSPPKPILPKIELEAMVIKSEFLSESVMKSKHISPDGNMPYVNLGMVGHIKTELSPELKSPPDLKPILNMDNKFDPYPSILATNQPNLTPNNKSKRTKKVKSSASTMSPSVSRKRNSRCKVCGPCLATDCGQCVYCLDKPKFGGPNRKKCACLTRRCLTMAKLSPRKSSKSLVTPQKEPVDLDEFELFNEALDDIPFEIEGHANTMGLQSRPWQLGPSMVEAQVRNESNTMCFNLSTTSMKRRISMDIKSEKKLKMEVPSDTAAKVEDHLQIYNQYKNATCQSEELYGDKDKAMGNLGGESFSGSEDQVSMNEKLLAVRFDHCYSNNIQYFAGLEEMDDAKSEVNHNNLRTYLESDELQVSETTIDLHGFKNTCIKFEEEEFEDEIGPLDDEELLKSDCRVSPEAEGALHFGDTGKGKDDIVSEVNDVDKSLFSWNSNFEEDLKEVDNYENDLDTEELLVEEYDELDSLERKEIEKQLSEDFDDEVDLNVSKSKDASISSFHFEGGDDTNFPLQEFDGNLMISHSSFKSEEDTGLEEVEAEYSFQSSCVHSDHLGSDGNSSSCSEVSSSPPAGLEKEKLVTIDDLVSQSEYFQTRPSVLKLWKAKDQNLEIDENLPTGWRMKVYTRKSGRLDIHYISPENMDVKTKFGVMEYMRLCRNYSKEEVERVAEYLKVSVDLE